MGQSQPHSHTAVDAAPFGAVASRLVRAGSVAGMVGLGCTALLAAGHHDDGRQFFHSYLLAVLFFLTISLGALFFVMLQHLTRAGWSTGFRRVSELMATNAPVLLLLVLPVLVPMLSGNASLFPWVDAHRVAEEEVLRAKQAYLNVPFFLVRWAIYLAVWTLLSRTFLNRSRRQDTSGDLALSLSLQRLAAPGMFLFALSLTFCAFDLVMSLEPHFFSTIFGVYIFAGSGVSFCATTIVALQLLQRAGLLQRVITTEHYHDLGKLMFGFIFFWAYIGFSQFMLYWYGNIPEETEWFLERQTGEWTALSLSLLFGHFLIPFPGLISRHVKRNRSALAVWAVAMLVMHWVDLYWLVMPSLSPGRLPLSLMDLTAWVGVGGVALANFGRQARTTPQVAARDPRLGEALAFENV